MRYATLMYTDPAHTLAMTKADFDRVMDKHATLRDELTASGELVGGAGLAVPDETTVLRLGPSGIESADGPLAAEAEIHVSAYYEIECASRERASQIAGRLLDDHVVAVELRRIHDTADA